MEHTITLSERDKMVLVRLLKNICVHDIKQIIGYRQDLDYHDYKETYQLVSRIYSELSHEKP